MEENTDTNVHTVQHTGCSSGMESQMVCRVIKNQQQLKWHSTNWLCPQEARAGI